MADVKHFDQDRALERAERLFWRRGTAGASVRAITAATGLNRSSLYATFGDKRELYRAALGRYVRGRSLPTFRALREDDRGLPAVREFFDALIARRCSGEHTGWGCMVANAHADAEFDDDPEVRALLDEHHRELRDALHAALTVARRRGQLAGHAAPDTAADVLTLLAYGVNLRSRAGVDAAALHRTVTAALAALAPEVGD